MRPEDDQDRTAILSLLNLPEETNDLDLFWAAYRHFNQPTAPHACVTFVWGQLADYQHGGNLPYWFERVRDEAIGFRRA